MGGRASKWNRTLTNESKKEFHLSLENSIFNLI